MKRSEIALMLSAAVAWSVTSCGGGDETTGTGGSTASSSGSATVVSVASSSTSVSSSSAGGGGPVDESTSCDDAVALEKKKNDDGGDFYDFSAIHAKAGDIDYFTFSAKKGEWIRVGTDVDPDTSDANTVITLLSEDGMTQFAQNNNVVGGSNVESELFYLSLEDANYCLKVEDYSTFNGDTPDGSPNHKYRATMVPIDFVLYDYYEEDVEPNDTTAAPQLLTYSENSQMQISAGIAGLYDPMSTTDVYEFTAPVGSLDVNVTFTPPGTNGYGSTQDPGFVSIYEADGTTFLAQLDVQKGARGLASVPVVAGNKYFLEVVWPSGETADTNDYYYLKFYTSTTLNQQEMDEAGNASSATPEIAPPQLDDDTLRHYIGGNLDVSGGSDTDWWSFKANKGDDIVLVCSSWRAGSGIRDATFEIYENPMGAALESETEVESKGILWSSTSSSATKKAVSATNGGTYFLKISATTQAVNITSKHYLCGIHVSAP